MATFEGPDVSFYDFLGVTPSASQDDINKAYRKKSRSLHPDKVKQQLNAERAKAKKNKKPGVNVSKPPSQSEIKAAVKLASDRQARLSIVANILKGSGRARYDHFVSNGFPKWKGTNYYYDRYRPGLGTVMFGVFLALGGGAHYIALYMGWKRQREFVERYIKFARHAAWGDNLGIPAVDVGTGGAPVGTAAPPPAPAEEQQEQAMPTNRKMRRMQEREAKKGNSQEGPKRGGRRAATRASSASGTATPTAAAGAASAGPQGAKKRVVAENGKVLVVDSLGDVYLEQEDEDGNMEEFLLDVSSLPQL
jgi:curved DNA-binding protein CbpA